MSPPAGEPSVAVVVLDALAAPPDPELDRLVGAGSAQRLRREVRAIARRWAAALAPGRAFEATSPAAAGAALGEHRGAVVLVAPDVPGLGPVQARTVLGELEAGTGVAVGSAHDGRPYLVLLARADPELLELADAGWEALMGAAAERELPVAMVRHERRLAGPGDARALALDPLAPPALARELDRLRPRPDAAP